MRRLAISLRARAPAMLRRRQHDLLPVAAQQHLIVVDRIDVEAIDRVADLGQHMRPSLAVEQQRLMTLRHHAHHAQRHPRVRRRISRSRCRAGCRLRLICMRE
jgi:hypothetical protein